MWEEGNSMLALLMVLLLTFIATSISLVFGSRRKLKEKDPYYAELTPCPNPRCIRCQRYVIVQDSARRKLPWLLLQQQQRQQQSHHATAGTIPELDRIIRGVSNHTSQTQSGQSQISPSTSFLSPVPGQYPSVLLIPDLPTFPIVTQYHKHTCAILEKHWDMIRNEYEQQLSKLDGPWMENQIVVSQSSSSSSSWNVLYLLNQGRWNSDALRCMPQTVDMLQTELGKRHGNSVLLEDCVFGNVFLSKIQRGTRIAPHCGPTNIRHRLHLPLVLPSSSSKTTTAATTDQQANNQIQPLQTHNNNNHSGPILKVREVVTTWTPKTAIVFDDSLCHSVEFIPTNDDDLMQKEERVVLIVDLFHYDLSIQERQFLQELYPAAT